jgi:hypothetical protein
MDSWKEAPIHEETALRWAIDILLRHRWCSRLRDGGQVDIEASLKMLSHASTTIYQEIAIAVVVAISAFMAFKLFVFVFKIIGLL